MNSQMTGKLREEVSLISRFTESYRRQFSSLIDRMNRGDQPTDLASLRLCIEAVDMMLSSQNQLCKALAEMTGPPREVTKATV
jgi:hypothetical protein